MSNKNNGNNQILEFWTDCKRFSILRYSDKNKNGDTYVIWDICKHLTLLIDYQNSIFSQNHEKNRPRKRVVKEMNKIHSFIEDLNWKEEIKYDLEWPICSELVDLDNNLKWSMWSKIYWSDCLINWMLKSSSWPYWSEKMSKSTVIKDRDWKKFVKYIEAEKNQSKNPIWNKHKIEWTMYWTDWFSLIWYKWITSKAHNNHNIIDYEDVPSQAQAIADNLMSDDKSSLKDRMFNIKMIESWRLVSRKITEEASIFIHEMVEKASNKCNKDNDHCYSLKKSKLNKGIEKWVEINDLQTKFKKTKDMRLFNEVLDSASKSKELMKDNNQNRDNCIKYLNQEGLFSIDRPNNIKFKCLVSDNMNKIIDLNIPEFSQDNKTKVIFSEEFSDIIIISLSLINPVKNKYYLKLELEENQLVYLDETDSIKVINPLTTEVEIGLLHRQREFPESDIKVELNFRLFLWANNQDDHLMRWLDKAKINIFDQLNRMWDRIFFNQK